MLLMGDFAQLPPALCTSLMARMPIKRGRAVGTSLVLAGKQTFNSFDDVIRLRRIHRQPRIDDMKLTSGRARKLRCSSGGLLGRACKLKLHQDQPAARSSVATAAERDFDSMKKAELRKAAKELGVCQCGVRVAELKAACKCAVREQQRQRTLTVWLAGNARVTESAAALSGTDPAHSGAGAVLEAACQALPVARTRIAAKRQQECDFPVFKAKNGGKKGDNKVALRRLKQKMA